MSRWMDIRYVIKLFVAMKQNVEAVSSDNMTHRIAEQQQ